MEKKNWIGVGISVLIAELFGLLAFWVAGDTKGIYQSLSLPPFSPPAWIFPIVWGLLYACMGVAAYLVYRARHVRRDDKKLALKLYVLQLVINVAWCLFFFRWEMFFSSVLVILVLDLVVAICIYAFHRIEQRAALWMFPYFLWILFATYLNVGVSILN